jgi:protein involved in polysaccharide export with SLBB domain
VRTTHPRSGRGSRRSFLTAAGALLVVACGGGNPSRPVNLPPPTERSVLGPGDVFVVEIVGERELPKEYQVAADGTVELPYVQTLKVGGLEAPEVARLIRQQLIERKILVDPSVIVQVKEFHSRRITLLGQVSKPGSFPYTPGLSFVGAVSLAGGLTGIANADSVTLTRKLDNGGTRTVVVDADDIIEGRAPDFQLQPGDQIYVRERLF